MINDPNYAICAAGDPVERLGDAMWQHTDDETVCTHAAKNTTLGWLTFTPDHLSRWRGDHPDARVGIVMPESVIGVVYGENLTAWQEGDRWHVHEPRDGIRLYSMRDDPRDLFPKLLGVVLDMVLVHKTLEPLAAAIRVATRPNMVTSPLAVFGILDPASTSKEFPR